MIIMSYETMSVTTDTKKQLAQIKSDFGYDTYDAFFKDVLKILEHTIKQGGLEV